MSTTRNDKYIGFKVGMLTLLSRDLGHKRARYICRCDCGVKKSIRKDHLLRSKIKSCGCISREWSSKAITGRVSKLLRPDNYSAKLKLYNRYRGDAREKDLPVEVDVITFTDIACLPCDYCNKAPDKLCKVNESSSKIMYTGVDRKDSNIGYILDNIVPCCTQCNMIKNNLLSYEEMKAVMKLVLEMRNNKVDKNNNF